MMLVARDDAGRGHAPPTYPLMTQAGCPTYIDSIYPECKQMTSTEYDAWVNSLIDIQSTPDECQQIKSALAQFDSANVFINSAWTTDSAVGETGWYGGYRAIIHNPNLWGSWSWYRGINQFHEGGHVAWGLFPSTHEKIENWTDTCVEW
jgi:hypothetical protein